MPEMIVWPVSSSVRTRKVGSSSASRCSALAELVLVGLGLRLDRDEMTGSGKLHRLEHDRRAARSHSVSPVVVCLRPDRGDDVAGADLGALLAVVGVHPQDAADALGLAVGAS